jgi:hypothetical protein
MKRLDLVGKKFGKWLVLNKEPYLGNNHHPPGQRVEDLISHAKEILWRYEPGALQ